MRFGKKVWIARRISGDNSEISEYDKPQAYITRPNYLNVMPMVARGYNELMMYGERATEMWSVIANNNYFYGKFSNGDLMWVDGAEPIPEIEEEYGNGATANAVVINVSEVNITTHITLEKNQNQVK